MWILAAFGAGPLGPSEDGVTTLEAEDAAVDLPPCRETWPYDLEQLPYAPDLWFRLNPRTAWGTTALITTLESAANRMAMLYPDIDPLLIGDLSTSRGGPLPPHKYHFDGRSADVGLYGWTGDKEDIYRHGNGFPPVAPRQLDLERTWTLIESLLETGNIEHILLDQTHIDNLKRWLLETGRRTREEVDRTFPSSSTPRLWTWDSIVRPAVNHKEHLHVRVRCE
ncbi:MAG: penicillin-insensitive murein endopeptidase [Alphaproteobacteria bacterium]|nr:penicillin-insensitive murein endopeptidase [Alphaproteobacteria bacterium]MCB9695166.1 penicillin-insensitive murein endopeptidase [Alphaproteobacteria bacterium]